MLSRFLTIGLIFITFFLKGQDAGNLHFDRLSSEQLRVEKGLSQNSIYSILQDNLGFMWFGTWDGLNKYDGYQYEIFRPAIFDTATALSNKSISSLFEDKEGYLWVGTLKGINRYNRKTGIFKVWKRNPGDWRSLSSDTISCIASANDGDLWIGTIKGLNKYQKATQRVTKMISKALLRYNIQDKNILCMIPDKENLWFAVPSGIFYFKPSIDQLLYWPVSRSELHFNDLVTRTMISDGKSGFWVGTNHGLLHLYPDFNRWKFYNHQINIQLKGNASDINAILKDHDGILWIGTKGGGLFKFDIETLKSRRFLNKPDELNSLSNNVVNTIFEDRSGIIWIGTAWNGINKLVRNKTQFQHIYPFSGNNKSLNNNLIWAFIQKSQDEMWIGTAEGINCFHKSTGTYTYIQHTKDCTNCLPGNKMRKFFRDSRGDIWVSIENQGICRLKNGDHRQIKCFRNIPDDISSIPSNTVVDIKEDASGYLWMATRDGGLARYNPANEQFYSYKHKQGIINSISSNSVSSVFIDSRKNIWAGTSNGLNLFIPSTQQFRVFQHDARNPNSLSSNDLFGIAEDKNGILWIGTSGGGLNRFDPIRESFKVYSEADGLSNNVVYNILIDESSWLWMSTNYGISCFDPVNTIFYNYDVRDGIQSNEYNYGAAYNSPDGEMYFGGMNGYNHFYPKQIRKNNFVPSVAVTSFSILNKQTPGELNSGDTIRLRHFENFFTISFAALDFTNPSRNRHKYFLEGLENDWILAEVDRHQVSYTDLQPGHYTFRLFGSNNDGIWSTSEFQLIIIVYPPWYSSWWFRALMIIVSALITLFLINLRIKKLEKKHNVEKKLLTLENQILDVERKALRLQMNPHFIFNAMNSIQGFILSNDTDKAIYYLSRFSHLMRLILNNSRESYVLLSNELKAIEYYVELERLRFDNSFKFVLEVDKDIDPEWTEIPPMLVQPYLENAIIHGFNSFIGEGIISLKLKWIDGLISITLEDNGIGRVRSKEIQESMGLQRTSMGMLITGKRLEILKKNKSEKFSIEVKDLYNNEGKATGTRVVIELVPKILN